MAKRRHLSGRAPIDIVQKRLSEHGSDMLQYGVTQRLDELRERLADRLRSEFDVALSPAEVMMTSGSQQGLYLLGRALLEDGDTAVVGVPTYVAALTAFGNLTDPEYLSIPLDEESLEVSRLESALEATSPSLVYVVPTYQNPTGITMSELRRHPSSASTGSVSPTSARSRRCSRQDSGSAGS